MVLPVQEGPPPVEAAVEVVPGAMEEPVVTVIIMQVPRLLRIQAEVVVVLGAMLEAEIKMEALAVRVTALLLQGDWHETDFFLRHLGEPEAWW